jgi:hypothetical protein
VVRSLVAAGGRRINSFFRNRKAKNMVQNGPEYTLGENAQMSIIEIIEEFFLDMTWYQSPPYERKN